jgi:chromate transport protein ChrA
MPATRMQRPTQKQAHRKAWLLLGLTAVCLAAGAFDHVLWLALAGFAFMAGVCAGRILECRSTTSTPA